MPPASVWNAARFPVGTWGRVLEDLAHPEATLQIARDFIETFAVRYVPERTPLSEFPDDRSLIGVGLFVSGPPKIGKTEIACTVLTEIVLGRRYDGITVLYVPWPDYIHFFNERHAWREGRGIEHEDDLESLDASMDRVMHDSLIVIDDIGRERITASGASYDELYRVLASRRRRGLVTIAVTGVGLPQMIAAYPEHLVEFLRGFTQLPVTIPRHRS